jgi:hypothetical protein
LRGCEGIAFGRHFFIFVGAGEALEEGRGFRFACEDRGSVVSAFEGVDFRIETEFAFLFLFAMAFDAALLQQRANLAAEIDGEKDGRDE